MKTQKEAAMDSMVAWLSDENELGRPPFTIECAGEFDLHEMHYYYFKYRKDPSAPWLLGVCGGYEGDGLEHCGHVFSRMEEYDEATAVEQATALVEQVREFWMNEAKRWEERGAHTGLFVGFVLLKEAAWDKDRLLRDLGEKWGVTLNLEPLNVVTDHPGNFLTRTQTAAELVRLIGSSRVRVLYDVYHMQLNEGCLCETIARYGDTFGHIHVADVPGRHEPGTGEIAYGRVYAALEAAGYDGLLGYELFPAADTASAVRAIMTE